MVEKSVLGALLLIAAVAACASDPAPAPTAADGGATTSSGGTSGGPSDGGVSSEGGGASPTCKDASECRLVDDYCGNCNCRALGPGEEAPTCSADERVSCESAPCRGRVPSCTEGRTCGSARTDAGL